MPETGTWRDDSLETISSGVIDETPGVNGVALGISSKPPATIEWP